MSEYTDFWNSLDLPADQTSKSADYRTVLANADALNLTPDEQYQLGWGMDATPEAWVRARAQQIQDEINGAKSTEVLKRGLDKGPLSADELAAKEKEDATTTASEKEAQASRGGGDYSGPSNTNTNTAADDSLGIDGRIDFGFDGKAAIKGALAGGPLGGLIGGVLGGSNRETFSNQETIDNFDRANFGVTGAQLDAERESNAAYDISNTFAGDADAAETDRNAAYDSANTFAGDYGGGGGNSNSSDDGGGGGFGGRGEGSDPDGGGMCVDPTTLILMADLTQKTAGALEPGDVLYTMHEVTGVFGEFAIEAMSIVQEPRRQIAFDNGTRIITSESHKFFAPGQRWVRVQDMQVGDQVVGINGTHTILDMQALPLGDVVKLTVNEAHTYVSEGLISHNKFAAGGKVTKNRLTGPNPKGPDDGFSSLDVDEFVVRRDAAKYYGDEVMQAINEGRIPAEALRRLLKK